MAASRFLSAAALVALICCASLGTVASAGPAAPEADGGTLQVALSSRKVSFNAKNCRLDTCLRFIAAETKVLVFADAYPDDPTAPEISFQDVPLHAAVTRLAQMFRRDVIWTGTALVLRHSLWAVKSRAPNPLFVWRTSVSGKGAVSGVPNSRGGKDIKAALFEATAGVFARSVAAETGIPFSIEKPLSDRRISVVTAGSAAEALAEGLATLLNGDTRIVIGQDKNRAAQETMIVQSMLDERTPDMRLSDEIRADLANVLTEDQKKTIANGGTVKLPFDQLPKMLRTKAERYLDLRWNNVLKGTTGFEGRSLDPAKGYTLHVENQLLIGLNVVLDDGTPLGL